jgi:hypothetical protein
MQGTNIILGYGETLTHGHTLKRGSGKKKYPYSIEEQRSWLEGQLTALRHASSAVPANAKPRGQSVVKLTLHPTFLAKSHHPNTLLAATGLRCIGSRATTITPRKEARADKEVAPTHTAVLFVAGRDQDFDHLGTLLRALDTAKVHKQALCRLELISWGCTEFCVNGFSFKPVAPGLQTGWRSGSVQLSSPVSASSISC